MQRLGSSQRGRNSGAVCSSQAGHPGEEGFLLLAVIFMLALLTIALAVAVPDITKSIQRDQEVETMHRGMQYRRAIQLYYRKFNAYPPSIDALVKTNNIRYLRKRYLDPMTHKDDWKPIYFGQNKAPLAMGFFGQPLGGGMAGATPVAGIGPSGGNTSSEAGFGGGSTGSTFGSSFGGGGSSIGGGSSFGGGSSAGGSSIFGSSATGGSGGGTTASGTGASGGSSDGSSSGGTGTGSGSSSGSGSSFMSGQNGQTFGGAGIVGFEPGDPKQSILLYKKKDHYNQWEFTYSPLSELKQQAGNGGLTGGSSGTGTGSNGTSGGFGGTSGGFGGSTGSFGGSSGGIGGSSSSFGGSGSTFGGSSGASSTQPQQ